MSYRIDFNKVNFWKKKYDEKTKETFFERVTESGSLYVRKKDHYYLSNKMLCNCINDASDKHENARICMYSSGNDEFYVIEPSGIKIPVENVVEIHDRSEIVKDNNTVFEDISINTFICNCISDRTRGGRETISAIEVETYKKENINFLGKSLVSNSFMPLDLVAMFSLLCYKSGVTSLNRDKLVEFIIEHKNDKKYSRLLKSIKIIYGEHYDYSPDIDKSIDPLKYMGMIHSDYSKEGTYDYNQYVNLLIDESIMYWDEMGITEELETIYPEMIDFVDEYIDVKNHIIPGVRNTAKRRKK